MLTNFLFGVAAVLLVILLVALSRLDVYTRMIRTGFCRVTIYYGDPEIRLQGMCPRLEVETLVRLRKGDASTFLRFQKSLSAEHTYLHRDRINRILIHNESLFRLLSESVLIRRSDD